MRIVAMVAALVLATSRMIAELYPLLFAVIIVLGAAIALLGVVLGLVFPARADQVRVRLATTEHDPVIF